MNLSKKLKLRFITIFMHRVIICIRDYTLIFYLHNTKKIFQQKYAPILQKGIICRATLLFGYKHATTLLDQQAVKGEKLA